MKSKNNTQKRKRPMGITLVIIWICYMVLRGILKAIDYSRIEISRKIFGTFGLVDYWIDIFILLAFVVFIPLFIKRIPSTWKYFIGFISFLILGIIIGNVYNFFVMDKIVEILKINLPPTVYLISTIVGSLFIVIFYVLIIYVVYKNRSYFGDMKNKREVKK